MNVPNSHVYFASCQTIGGIDMGVVKVGVSNNPEARVKSVTSTSPFICNLLCSTPGDLFLESFCHMWLRQYRLTGEFFSDCPEIQRLIGSVKDTGKLPFPIKFVDQEAMFIHLDIAGYMERNGITLSDVQKATGVSCAHYQKILDEKRCGNRRILAAVAVTAVRKGLTVLWARDFNPVPARAAA